jgi:hypothetical protein
MAGKVTAKRMLLEFVVAYEVLYKDDLRFSIMPIYKEERSSSPTLDSRLLQVGFKILPTQCWCSLSPF